jgi:hypothetical protein
MDAGSITCSRQCSEAAVGATRTDTCLRERSRRIARRRGKNGAIVAVGRSVLVIAWALLSDENAQFADLGPDGWLVSRLLRFVFREL